MPANDTEANIENGVHVYLSEIARFPLLDAAQELALGKRISEGDTEAMQTLINANLRLVVSIAKRYVSRGVLLIDLIQEGNMGLMHAAKKYDYRKGWRFSTYATWWISQALSRCLSNHAFAMHVPAHRTEIIFKLIGIQRRIYQDTGVAATCEEIAEIAEMDVDEVTHLLMVAEHVVSLDAPLNTPQDDHYALSDTLPDLSPDSSPEDSFSQMNLHEAVERELARINARERGILALHFGLVDGKEYNLEQIGRRYHVTRERVRQIIRDALRKLRNPSTQRALTG